MCSASVVSRGKRILDNAMETWDLMRIMSKKGSIILKEAIKKAQGSEGYPSVPRSYSLNT